MIESNLKTINGTSLLGSGNIKINPTVHRCNNQQSIPGKAGQAPVDHVSAVHNITSTSKIATLANCNQPGDLAKHISRILVDGVEIDLECFSRDSSAKTTIDKATTIGYPLSVGMHVVDIYYKDVDGNEIYTVTDILHSSLKGCDRLTNLFLPSELEVVGDRALQGCERINTIKVPEKVRSIGKHAFADCSALTNIYLPYGVESIGDMAFSGCKSLTSIKLPGLLNTIGEAVFNNCVSLETIYISDCTFNLNIDLVGCTNIHNIYCEGLACAIDVSSSMVAASDWNFGVTLKNMTPSGSIKFNESVATALKESLDLTWCNVEWSGNSLVYKTSK